MTDKKSLRHFLTRPFPALSQKPVQPSPYLHALLSISHHTFGTCIFLPSSITKSQSIIPSFLHQHNSPFSSPLFKTSPLSHCFTRLSFSTSQFSPVSYRNPAPTSKSVFLIITTSFHSTEASCLPFPFHQSSFSLSYSILNFHHNATSV